MGPSIQTHGYSKEQAYQYITQRKQEIIENIKHGNPQNKVQTGALCYSTEEWDRLLKKVDTKIDEVKEELKEEEEEEKEDKEDKEQVQQSDSLKAYHLLNSTTSRLF